MPLLVQICMVVATLAFVALVVATVRALVRLGRDANELASAARLAIGQVERILLEANELLAAVRELASPARRVAGRFQRLGERVADLSTAVLDGIESPVFTAVAIARGISTGTARLMEHMSRRAALHPTTHNGDLP